MSRGLESALIGHTGFVGSNLLRQHPFANCYHSADIETIAGCRFDLVVCAGVRAEKWIANADPERDRAAIDRLLAALTAASADRVVLISTVDVFASPRGGDERTTIESAGLQPYGLNRRYLETEVAEHFETTIVRLPGLYGHGLKKNVIYDFLHDHETHKIDSGGIFQFYGVDRLWRDIRIAIAERLPLVHLVTEPVTVQDVAEQAFHMPFLNHVTQPPARYDLHTNHSASFGGQGPYIESRDQVLAGIRQFVSRERAQ